MTTTASQPLRREKISRPRPRNAEIAMTLADRFAVIDRETPGSLPDLVDLVQRALDEDKQLRIIGAGRGLSVATDPVDTLAVSTENLKRIYPRHGRDIVGLRLRSGLSHRALARVQAGCPARTLLASLTSETPPRTLVTHGSGDFQSIVGALSTGTHGTGPFPSLAGLVRAIVVVRVDASGPTPVPRVELLQRTEGTSGPQAPVYDAPRGGSWRGARGIRVHAVFDDDAFFATTVGLGCTGLVYCVTVDVLPEVPLMEESRVAHRLDEVFALLRQDHATPGVRCEVVVDPYPRDTRSGSNPKRWDEVVAFPTSRDFTTFRGQYIKRSPSSDRGPSVRGLPPSMALGREPEAARLIGGRICKVLENPVCEGPEGAAAMIQCSGVKRYVDWLPQVLLLNLKYTGTGSEWAVPWPNLEDAIWALLEQTELGQRRFRAHSDARGCWTGTDAQLEDLLMRWAPVYNGPAIRFVAGEGALLAGSNALGRAGPVPLWTTIEVGFLGRPDIEEDWRPRKRHAGLRPEEPVPVDDIERLLGKLNAADAVSPGGSATWPIAHSLPPVRSRKKRRQMRLFAAYEHGRLATLRRMTDAVCTPAIGGRPHQGLYNAMSWSDVVDLWPQTAEAWLERFRVANPVGTFDNALTTRWGLGALRDPAPSV
jgi:hypothetical protein